ncbi:hypothetical protein ACTL6U_05275 [Rhodovibrionaceae bacterium A322]
MKKLILHCGLHKTGTTALQDFLFDRQEELATSGYRVATENHGDTYRFRNLGSWVDLAGLNHDSGTLREGLFPMLARLAESGKTVIFSSEALSLVFSEREIQKLARELRAIFDEIKIVFYLRRQDHLALSHFAQRAKNYSVEGTFYDRQNRSPLPLLTPNAMKYLNHNARLGSFATAFGKDALIVRVYDKRQLVGGNTISDFQDLLGTEIDHPAPVINRTFGFERSKYHGDLIDQGLAVHGSLLHRLGRAIQDSRPLTVDRRSAVKFYQMFHEGNLALNRSLEISDHDNIFGLDFSDYPVEASYDWQKQDVETLLRAIAHTCEDVKTTPAELDIAQERKLLTSAAAFFGRMDLRLSEALLALANDLDTRNKGSAKDR